MEDEQPGDLRPVIVKKVSAHAMQMLFAWNEVHDVQPQLFCSAVCVLVDSLQGI